MSVLPHELNQLNPQSQDQVWMRCAIALAQKGQYATRPNPNVGCVIVKDGQMIGEGFHPQAGQPHAEVLHFVRRVKLHVVLLHMSL